MHQYGVLTVFKRITLGNTMAYILNVYTIINELQESLAIKATLDEILIKADKFSKDDNKMVVVLLNGDYLGTYEKGVFCQEPMCLSYFTNL